MSPNSQMTDDDDSSVSSLTTTKPSDDLPWKKYFNILASRANENDTFHPWSRLPLELKYLVLGESARESLAMWVTLRQVDNNIRRFTLRRLPYHITLETSVDHVLFERILQSITAAMPSTPESNSITLTLIDGLRDDTSCFNDNMSAIKTVQQFEHLSDLRLEIDPALCPASPLYQFPPLISFDFWNKISDKLSKISFSELNFIGGTIRRDLIRDLRGRSVSETSIDRIRNSPFPPSASLAWQRASPDGTSLGILKSLDGIVPVTSDGRFLLMLYGRPPQRVLG